MPVGRLKPALFKTLKQTKNMTVTTDDTSTLIRLVREGLVTKVSLVFSWRYMTYLYLIETNL